MTIDVRASVDTKVAPEVLYAVVRDLKNYPHWLDLVHCVEVDSTHGDEHAWIVELQARIGPFARSKRLRMVRSVDTHSSLVVFERRENDGKQHASWTLKSEVSALSSGSALHMTLQYGGSLYDGGVVEKVLSDQIERGKVKLKQFLVD